MIKTDPEHSQDDDHNDIDRRWKRRWTHRYARQQRWRWQRRKRLVKAHRFSDRRDSNDTVVAWMRRSWRCCCWPNRRRRRWQRQQRRRWQLD